MTRAQVKIRELTRQGRRMKSTDRRFVIRRAQRLKPKWSQIPAA
jgi:hypothetical protein